MTVQLGYHASHEQFGPVELLDLARAAEAAGFDAVMSSDHLAPWSPDGESAFAWSWLGAVAATTRLDLAAVSAPGQRYHPAVLAQAIATVAALAPGRLTVALGSGQLLNEHVTGDAWPDKPERNARLAECAAVIRRLLDGEVVSHDGRVRVDRARLHSRPTQRPRLIGAAMTPGSAAEVAAWAEGLITVNAPWATMREVIDAYRGAGGTGPVHVQVHVSWAPDERAAWDQALAEWSMAALEPAATQDLALPEDVAAATADATAEDLQDSIVVSADLDDHVDWLCTCAGLGVERIIVHQVGRDQARFVSTFGREVLPRVRERLGGR